jgi:hypothetical protein
MKQRPTDSLNDQFIFDPRTKKLGYTAKFAGHMMTAVLDYAKEQDISKMTLDDVFLYLNRLDSSSDNC